jgi:hypothetical protein
MHSEYLQILTFSFNNRFPAHINSPSQHWHPCSLTHDFQIARMGLDRRVGAGVCRRHGQRRRAPRLRASGRHSSHRNHLPARGGAGRSRRRGGPSLLRHHRRYGVALFLESILLCASVPLLKQNNIFGIYSASCACGLQNAMMSTYSGAVIRTTHVSGMFTDLGIFLGHALRGLPVDSRRLRLCLLVISGFLVGGILGAVAFHRFNYSALLIPAALAAFTSLVYGIYLLRCGRNN